MNTQERVGLSEQQLCVICLSWEGLSVKEIAIRMNLSARTVKNYRAHLYEKFDVHNVEGLLRKGVEQGFLSGSTFQYREEWP
jgi:DNA-binding NarL/FixJ family response regulator